MTTPARPAQPNWLLASLDHNPTPPALELPTRYAGQYIADLPVTSELTKVARRYVDQFWTAAPEGLAPVFLGSVRSGKTETSAALARAVHGAGVETLFVDLGEVLARLDRDRFAKSTGAFITRMKAVPFLIADDFTCVERGSWGATLLVELISERWNGKRPTIWTGNVPVDPRVPFAAVTSHLGPHFARRLEDGGKSFTALTQ